MGKGYLLDTNIIIDFTIGRFPAHVQKKIGQIIDANPHISIINKIELLGFHNVPPEIVTFTKQAAILALDDAIVLQTISLRKLHKIKLPDAVIAATSMVFDLTLVTANIGDFKNIQGLKLLTTAEV